jgi:hypothetical protein
LETRNLKKEIEDLEKSQNIKYLSIETLDGILTPSVAAVAIDSVKDTLSKINLNEIAKSVEQDIKAYTENV